VETSKNFRILHYETVGSTNQLARQFAEQGEPEGLLIVADQQVAGKGRSGKDWFSVPGESLTFSLLLRPIKKNPEQCPQLALILGLTLAQTMENMGFKPQLKWPNDVYLHGKKIAGILLENAFRSNQIQWIIAGIGVNLNVTKNHFSQELRNQATSLLIEGKKKITHDFFLQKFLIIFSSWYCSWINNDKMQYLLEEYTKRSILLGCLITYEKKGRRCQGWVERIDENGGLWVTHQEERHRLSWGEVTIALNSNPQTLLSFESDGRDTR
jgi:BirA family biotin operon repressor/biotin-[acetyl-CoA-carboxylase] ligase